MNFFSKKDDSLIDERVRLTKIYLDQQKEENSELRTEHDSLKEFSLRNRLLLDDQAKGIATNEKFINTITEQNKTLESSIKANEEMISKLEDEINQLRGVKSTYLPTDFFLVNNQSEELQEALDNIIEQGDLICFKDLNGNIWQIERKNNANIKDDSDNENIHSIDEIQIKVNLNE